MKEVSFFLEPFLFALRLLLLLLILIEIGMKGSEKSLMIRYIRFRAILIVEN